MSARQEGRPRDGRPRRPTPGITLVTRPSSIAPGSRPGTSTTRWNIASCPSPYPSTCLSVLYSDPRAGRLSSTVIEGAPEEPADEGRDEETDAVGDDHHRDQSQPGEVPRLLREPRIGDRGLRDHHRQHEAADRQQGDDARDEGAGQMSGERSAPSRGALTRHPTRWGDTTSRRRSRADPRGPRDPETGDLDHLLVRLERAGLHDHDAAQSRVRCGRRTVPRGAGAPSSPISTEMVRRMLAAAAASSPPLIIATVPPRGCLIEDHVELVELQRVRIGRTVPPHPRSSSVVVADASAEVVDAQPASNVRVPIIRPIRGRQSHGPCRLLSGRAPGRHAEDSRS